jgi:hypothetical protein
MKNEDYNFFAEYLSDPNIGSSPTSDVGEFDEFVDGFR